VSDNQSKKEIHDSWKADVDEYRFFDKMWSDYDPIYEIIPVDPEEWNAWYSGSDDDPNDPWFYDEPQAITNESNPLDNESPEVQNAINSLRSWGQGPVIAGMKALDFSSINNQQESDMVIDWLEENYDDIFDIKGLDDIKFTPPDEEYIPKELDIQYTPRYDHDRKVVRHAFNGDKYPINSQPSIDMSHWDKFFVGGKEGTNSLYDFTPESLTVTKNE